MRLPRRADSLPFSLLSVFALLELSSAVTLDCNDVGVSGFHYDFSSLKGPHAVHWIRQEDLVTKNFTFIIDLCAPLKKPKDIDIGDDVFPNGIRVVGLDEAYSNGKSMLQKVVPIAGNFMSQKHRALDPKWTRLKDSDSSSDSSKDGLRLELNGGQYPWTGKNTRTQKAFVEFVCDKSKTGLEGDDTGGFEDDKNAKESEQRRTKRAEEDEKSTQSLQFVSYKAEGKDSEIDVLRLNWSTKSACEENATSTPKSDHWGFFTWLIIILFLVTAAYLIFGSWLNYNRYGARGWDLVPHGDTLRDIPYYLKDFGRRTLGAFQSPARRGGYSAV